jgi:hypothetical protein
MLQICSKLFFGYKSLLNLESFMATIDSRCYPRKT